MTDGDPIAAGDGSTRYRVWFLAGPCRDVWARSPERAARVGEYANRVTLLTRKLPKAGRAYMVAPVLRNGMTGPATHIKRGP